MREQKPAAALTRRCFLTAPRTNRPRPIPDDGYWIRVHRRAMACRFEITFEGTDAGSVPAAQEALNEIDDIEDQLSVFRETSALSYLNARAATEAVRCDRTLFELLARCARLSADTDGAFDITSTPLSRSWGFLRRQGRLPTVDEIASARSVVGMQHVLLTAERSEVRFGKRGVALNLGAVGKGHALDRVAVTLRQRGVTDALLSAGRSSLLAIGGRGRGWVVDIMSPRRPSTGDDAARRSTEVDPAPLIDESDRPIARVRLRDRALGTSGAGEQFFEVAGQRYGHVLDPRTGWPANAMLSASVICESAADADALSTAFLVGGPVLAERYCAQHPRVLALLTPAEASRSTFLIGDRTVADVEEI